MCSSHDGLSRDEFFDCALLFFIKSGIPIIASANHHILLEMWAGMDSGQLFSAFNEWMKRLEYVIESGGEYYTKKTLCFDCLPVRQNRQGVNCFLATL
jgi:hypothetical protein